MNRYILYASSSDLYHYGIQRKSGRYPWGSGGRPFQSLEEKGKRRKARAEQKLAKISSKVQARQNKATQAYSRAEKKAGSFLSTRAGTRRAYESAADQQRKVNRLEVRGKKYYEKQVEKLAKLDIALSQEAQEIGERFIQDVLANNRTLYSQMAMTNTYNIENYLSEGHRLWPW